MLTSRLKLHMLTDRERSRGRDILSIARAALDGGATVIQLRDKIASKTLLIEEGHALRALTREYHALLIVNDHVDVALTIDADGAHVGQDDMSGSVARRLLGEERVLGISAGNREEAMAAIASGADYLGVGPIFATQSKGDAGAPIGTPLLTWLATNYTIPLVAIGGITAENAHTVIQAGATGVAVITAITSAEDSAAATRRLAAALGMI